MRHLALPLLVVLVVSASAAAAEPLAIWSAGPGVIADAPAAVGAGVAADQMVVAGDHAVRLTLAKAPAASLYLSPGASLRLRELDGGLQVRLEKGQLEADIAEKGPYRELHVLGVAIDVRVTGTLFVVERTAADRDYVALVRGKVGVKLRRDVAEALGQLAAGEVQLEARQGLEGSIGGGVGRVDQLLARPQIQVAGSSERSSLHDQGMAAAPGSWGSSDAAAATGGPAGTVEPLPGAGAPAPTADAGINATTAGGVAESGQQIGVGSQLGAEITTQIDQAIHQEMSQGTTTTVVNQTVGGSHPIAGPPGPPP